MGLAQCISHTELWDLWQLCETDEKHCNMGLFKIKMIGQLLMLVRNSTNTAKSHPVTTSVADVEIRNQNNSISTYDNELVASSAHLSSDVSMVKNSTWKQLQKKNNFNFSWFWRPLWTKTVWAPLPCVIKDLNLACAYICFGSKWEEDITSFACCSLFQTADCNNNIKCITSL